MTGRSHTATALATAEQVAMRLGYLAIVQGIVARLATSASAMKAASPAVMAALLVFSVSQNVRFHWALFVVAGAVFFIFHGYFLQQERAFRALYNAAADRALADVVSMKIDARRLAEVREPLSTVLFRPTVWGFHLALIAGFTVTSLFAQGAIPCCWM